MLLHSCESISTRLEGTTSTSAECDQISIDHRPRALDGGAEVRESDIQASTDSPNRRRRNTARIDSKPANPLLIPSYAAGCVSQKNSPDLGGTPLTLTEVFGWMCVIPLLRRSDTIRQVGCNLPEVLHVPGVDDLRLRFPRARHQQSIVDPAARKAPLRGLGQGSQVLVLQQRH